MDFHRTRKTKKKQTKHTHRVKTSGRATAWGATAARLLRVPVLAVDVPAVGVEPNRSELGAELEKSRNRNGPVFPVLLRTDEGATTVPSIRGSNLRTEEGATLYQGRYRGTYPKPSVACFHNIIFRYRANSVLGGTPPPTPAIKNATVKMTPRTPLKFQKTKILVRELKSELKSQSTSRNRTKIDMSGLWL